MKKILVILGIFAIVAAIAFGARKFSDTTKVKMNIDDDADAMENNVSGINYMDEYGF